MKGFFCSLGLALLALSQPVFAALQESNTVPTKQLITDFSVIKAGGENDVEILAYLLKAPEDKTQGPSMLRVSDNDILTFSVEGTSAVCKQDQSCRLPFVKGATYKAEVKRFNGEVVQSEIKIPEETSITSPGENSIFNKKDSITVSWTPSAAPTRGITVSTFLAGLNCDTAGSVKWDEPTTAVIPAGYVASCPGLVKGRFTAFYLNSNKVPGVAGGVLKGYALASLHFAYLDQEEPAGLTLTSDNQPLSREELVQVIRQTESGPGFGQTILQ